MTIISRILNSRPFFWALLALPAVPMLLALASGAADPEGRPATEFLLHPTGEFAARFMIIAMALTPLRLLFPASKIVRWLMARRRAFGVAAFGFAALHTVLYVADMGTVQAMLAELPALGIWTGWLAMLIFLPLGLTSNNAAMRWLGRHWKTLQRFVYAAAVATLMHWLFVHNNVGAALAHFLPLAALELYRLWHGFFRPAVALATKESSS
jgi:methionine sulfoxide reductase heme-binding subunit